jgi:RHS repeat-associated protein
MMRSAACSPSVAFGHAYKFTGKERDTESGLDYFGARYHSSALGRFVSVDPSSVSVQPLNPQSWNRYNYTYNNPLKFVDHDGKAPNIAIIENGPTQGNPIGHTAIAVTGQGVLSFGNLPVNVQINSLLTKCKLFRSLRGPNQDPNLPKKENNTDNGSSPTSS